MNVCTGLSFRRTVFSRPDQACIPANGLGQRYTPITRTAVRTDGQLPLQGRGVPNDAVSIYFGDATLANAFVAWWCIVAKVETAGGVFQVREDEPEPRVRAELHRTT